MRRDASIRFSLIAAAITCLVILAAPVASGEESRGAVEFAVTSVFFEYNSSDKDLGIHMFFDAPGWKEVQVTSPGRHRGDDDDGDLSDRSAHRSRRHGRRGDDRRVIFEVENGGALQKIGSTEVFTESAEPGLCPEDEEDCEGEVLERAIDAFLSNFPEGTYAFSGRTVDGRRLVGDAELSHQLPGPVEIVDPEASFPTITWTPSEGVEIVAYQVIAEVITQGTSGEEQEFVQTTDVPPTVTSIVVSDAFSEAAEEFRTAGTLLELKVEVIAVGSNGNKTSAEAFVFEAPQP